MTTARPNFALSLDCMSLRQNVLCVLFQSGCASCPSGGCCLLHTTSSVRRDHEKPSRHVGRPRTLGCTARSGSGPGSERRQQVQEHAAGWPERQQPAWCCCGRPGPGQQVPGARASARCGASSRAASGAATAASSAAASAASAASSGSAPGAAATAATAATASSGAAATPGTWDQRGARNGVGGHRR